jgi:hypothetical protein
MEVTNVKDYSSHQYWNYAYGATLVAVALANTWQLVSLSKADKDQVKQEGQEKPNASSANSSGDLTFGRFVNMVSAGGAAFGAWGIYKDYTAIKELTDASFSGRPNARNQGQ